MSTFSKTWSLLIGSMLISAMASAASISSYSLEGVLSSTPKDAGAYIGSDRHIFAQAVNPTVPGFVLENGSNQWAYVSSDGNATSNVLANAIQINGAPALLGIPGEVGSFTIGASNTIEDLITERYYYRPAIFLQIRDSSLSAGVSVLPVAPLMAGNKFKFVVNTAAGFESADLEGVTVDYFVAEEGWHHLVDDRVLLVSSTELKDTNFAGKSFELGASFTSATTVVQLQRPMLKRWTKGEYYGISRTYQGATLVSGSDDFNSLHLRLMRDASTEGSSSDVFAGRVGFMVLGSVAEMERGFHIEKNSESVRYGAGIRNDLSYFKQRPHGAAASPLLGKSACSADDDISDMCFYLTPPVDTFSRGIFNTPRMPYVDADFEPLQAVRSYGMDKEYTGGGTKSNPHFDYWRDEVTNSLLDPQNDYLKNLGQCPDSDCSIKGALSRMNPDLQIDRGWDDNFFWSDWWFWLTVRHYPTCLYDGVSTACVDFAVTDNTILGGDNLAWYGWHTRTDSDEFSYSSGEQSVFYNFIQPETSSTTQQIFDEAAYSRVASVEWLQRIVPPDWAAGRLANYLNYELPEEISWQKRHGAYEGRGYDYLVEVTTEAPDKYNWDAWQIQGVRFEHGQTEIYRGATNEYKAAQHTTFVNPNVKGWLPSQGITPKAAPLSQALQPNGYLFANVPWGVPWGVLSGENSVSYRWARSASADGSNPVTVASNVFGYQATSDDQGQWLAFCMTQEVIKDKETETIENCSRWHKVNLVPVASNVNIQMLQPVAISGTQLEGFYDFFDPNGKQPTSTHQWQNRLSSSDDWQDISGATEDTYQDSAAVGNQVRYCVTPSTAEATGGTVCSAPVTYDSDFDGDGIGDSQDWDDDNDGYGDSADAFPFDDTEWLDTDGDGIGNNTDTDDDNDGLSDTEEETLGEDGFITDPLDNNTDDDAFLDGEDPSPNDSITRDWADTDGDGTHDDEDDDIDGDNVTNANDEAPFVACTDTAITVTSNADSGPGTLREAMENLCANAQFSDLNVISFAEAMTINLESPLLVTKGMKIDGDRQVTIDGNNANELFRVIMPDHLPGTQFLHLSGLTLTGGKSLSDDWDHEDFSAAAPGSVVNITNGRLAIIQFSLIADNQAPAFGSVEGSYTLENSVLARTHGGLPAVHMTNGRLSVVSSTLLDHEGGSITMMGDGDVDLFNSLILHGETGSAECSVSNWLRRQNSWVEDSACGVTSDGWVFLADPDYNDFRPVPGSASIDAGYAGEGLTVDFLGNERVMGIYDEAAPGGPVYPKMDIGAIEYDPFGDFDLDGTADTDDAFPLDPTETADTDGDNVGDNADAFPSDPAESVDTDGDTIGNNADPDDDNDGVDDGADAFPLDKTEWADADGDGTGDNADTDDDNNGIMDAVDQISIASTESTGSQTAAMAFTSGDGEQVVLAFALSSTETGNEVRAFTFAAGGDLDPANDIAQVRLYRDDNQDGVADADELLDESTFELAGGLLTFTLPEAYPLPVGDTHFLVTYEF